MTTKYLFIHQGQFVCLKDANKTTFLHDKTPTTKNCIPLSNDIHLYILETYCVQRYRHKLLPEHEIIYVNCYDAMNRLQNDINSQTTKDYGESFYDFEKIRVLKEQIKYHILHFEYLGLEEEEALKLAKNNNHPCSRVLQRDDKPYGVTAEGITGRLSFFVKNGVVVRCIEG